MFIIPESIFQPDKPCLIVDTGSVSLRSYLVGHTPGIDYKSIRNPTSLYDRYEVTLQNFQINIVEQGLPLGMKSFIRGEGNPSIREFSAVLNIFNCVEPMHPVFPTLEMDVVIKSLEIMMGVRFLEGVLKIKNSLLESLDTADEEVFQNVKLQQMIKVEKSEQNKEEI